MVSKKRKLRGMAPSERSSEESSAEYSQRDQIAEVGENNKLVSATTSLP